MGERTLAVNLARKTLALSGAVACAAAMLSAGRRPTPEPLVFLACGIVLGGVLYFVPRLGFQLVARAAGWAALFSGLVMNALFLLEDRVAADHNHGFREHAVLAAWTVAAVVSLIAAGRLGLDDHRGPFRPVALRGPMLVSLVMAAADALLFTSVGGVLLVDRWEDPWCVAELEPVLFVLGLGLLMATSAWLMYRLKVVGVLLMLVGNLGFAAVLLVKAGNDPFSLMLAGNALLQAVIQLPLLRAMVTGRVPSTSRSLLARHAVTIALCIVGLGCAAAAAMCA